MWVSDSGMSLMIPGQHLSLQCVITTTLCLILVDREAATLLAASEVKGIEVRRASLTP
jgi:hypothetical protein